MVHVAVVAALTTYNYITFLLEFLNSKDEEKAKTKRVLAEEWIELLYIYTINQ